MKTFLVRHLVTGQQGIVVGYAGYWCLVVWADGSMSNASPDQLRWEYFSGDWPQTPEMVNARRHWAQVPA